MREVVVGAGRAIGSWCGGVCGRDVMVVVNWWVEGSGGGGVCYTLSLTGLRQDGWFGERSIPPYFNVTLLLIIN